MIITLLVFLLILGLLVFVHEFGHFWVAKRLGIKVHEFAFGFKPRLLAWKRGETEYAINLIPLGGYVRLEGEQEDTGKKGSFMGQSASTRAAVLVAGVVMNLILAWVLLTLTYGLGSYPLTPTFDKHAGIARTSDVVVVSVSPNSPAEASGIKVGDHITAINNQPVIDSSSLTETIKTYVGQKIMITYRRDNQVYEVRATPRSNPPANEGAFGIGTGELASVKVSWLQAPWYALRELGSEIQGTFVGFTDFVKRLVVKQEVSENVSGIVGIGAATGIVRRLGIAPLLQFIALISTNLAVVNILPILPLDGGHLLVTAIEAITRRKVRDVYRYWVTMAGLAAILILFVVVTYRDFITFSIFERLKNLF